VLFARAQYLIFGAELGEGSLADVKWILQPKQCFTTNSLNYSDVPM
jgi:hypothetical protein